MPITIERQSVCSSINQSLDPSNHRPVCPMCRCEPCRADTTYSSRQGLIRLILPIVEKPVRRAYRS